MKPIIVCITTVLLFMFARCTSSSDPTDDNTSTITIGAILPLTGDEANYGKGLKQGMDLAVKEINADSNNLKIKIVFEDDKGNPSAGISAYNKLRSIEKVNFIIGGMFSNVALSIAPIAEKDSVIFMSPTASVVDLTKFGDHVFRIYPSDSYDGDFLADFAYSKLQAKSVAIVTVEAASTIEISNVFTKRFKSLNGTISSSNSYKQGEKNFRTILHKLKNDPSEVVFLPGYIDDVAILLKQSKELGLNKTYLTISTVYDKKLIEIAGAAAEGLIFSAPAFDISSSSPEIQKFVTSYTKEYNAPPDLLAAYGYDVVMISYQAASKAKNKALSEIINNLYAVKNYPGVTGTTSFDRNGDVLKQLEIMIVRNGMFVEY